MDTNQLFVTAMINGYRYRVVATNARETSGDLSTEDLFQASKPQLEQLHKALSEELRSKTVNSLAALVGKKPAADTHLENRVAIVEQVYRHKVEEEEKAERLKKAREHNRKIREQKARNAENQLLTLTNEELDAMLLPEE